MQEDLCVLYQFSRMVKIRRSDCQKIWSFRVNDLEIIKNGDTITLRPARPDWLSLAECQKVDADFLQERTDVISDEGRFAL